MPVNCDDNFLVSSSDFDEEGVANERTNKDKKNKEEKNSAKFDGDYQDDEVTRDQGASDEDPLYQAALTYNATEREVSNTRVATAAYKSPRFRRVMAYVTRKYDLDPEDTKQDLIVALIQALQLQSVSFPVERALFSYLIRIAANFRAKKLATIESQFLSYDARRPGDTEDNSVEEHSMLFSDGGAQAAEMEEAMDNASLRARIGKYREAQHNRKLLLQSSHFTHDRDGESSFNKKNVMLIPAKKAAKLVQVMPAMNISGGQAIASADAPQEARSPTSDTEPNELLPSPGVLPPLPIRRGRPPGAIHGSSVDQRRTGSHKELHELWQRSKLHQQDYAQALDISPTALKSYLYVRTKSVPDEVMEAARKHAEENKSEVGALEMLFEDDMDKIIARWEREFAGESLSDAALATALGINSSTVNRWRGKGDSDKRPSKPDVRDLARYELTLKNFFKKN